MLRDVTQRTMFDVLDRENIGYSFHKQENRLTFDGTGSTIIFRSLDNPETLRGTNLAWFGVDEATYCKAASWARLEARLREPRALRQCGVGAWTPKGFDWIYERFIRDPQPDHGMTFASPRENIHLGNAFYDSLRSTYDEKFYRQEVMGEYLSLTSGQVYYAFDREQNVKPLYYDPNFPLFWSPDFNVDPMCSVIGQVIESRGFSHADLLTGNRRRWTHVLDEICLRNANIYDACREFVARTERWIKPGSQMLVHLYGDPAGSARSHAGPSSYQCIFDFFKTQPKYRIEQRTATSHPEVKDRVNVVNGQLCSAAGQRNLLIDPKCKELMKDLEKVIWKADLSGNITAQIDKSDPMRTHISDAMGYAIHAEFGGQRGGVASERLV